MKHEVEFALISLLEFLTAVLLISDDGFQPALPYAELIVNHRLIMLHLLERSEPPVVFAVVLRQEFARLFVALALDDAWGEMIISQFQV